MWRHKRMEQIGLPLLGVAVFLCLWHFFVKSAHSKVFPSPAAVARGLVEITHKGLLLRYLRDSLLRVAGGYGAALVLGIPLGLTMGWYRLAARALNPIIQLMRPISPIAWIPVSIVLFGVSNLATIFLVFLGAFFPVVVSTMNGVANIPPMYLLAGRNFGLSPTQIFRRVLLPAALPQILIGLRVALGIGWLVVVAAEMVAVDSGLGYLIIDSRNAGKRYDLVVAGMLLIGTTGFILDVAIRRIETLRSVRWGFREE